MKFSLIPDVIANSVLDISPRWLQNRGIEALLMDFDNTIFPYAASALRPETLNWIDEMKERGIKLAVVSNSGKTRVKEICEGLGIGYVRSAFKPRRGGVVKAAALLGTEVSKTALVGDQIFTDVLAANRSGATSILIKPIVLSNPVFWLRHQIERPMIFLGRKNRIRKEDI